MTKNKGRYEQPILSDEDREIRDRNVKFINKCIEGQKKEEYVLSEEPEDPQTEDYFRQLEEEEDFKEKNKYKPSNLRQDKQFSCEGQNICISCGKFIENGKAFCSKDCEDKFQEYLRDKDRL